MAIKEIHTLNGEYTVYMEYHRGDGEVPEPIEIKPLELVEGGFTFVGNRYGYHGFAAKSTDLITISFERI